MDGWKGDDVIKTGSGTDEIYGGEGNDQIDRDRAMNLFLVRGMTIYGG